MAGGCRSACPRPQDAFARGEVFIGSRESGYTVLDGLPPSTQGHHWPHGITIVTPERRFLLACETEPEQRAWVEAFRKVVDRPMLPQEYAGEGGQGWPGGGALTTCTAVTKPSACPFSSGSSLQTQALERWSGAEDWTHPAWPWGCGRGPVDRGSRPPARGRPRLSPGGSLGSAGP